MKSEPPTGLTGRPTDRYTLPAELGGGEVEVLHGMADEGHVAVKLPSDRILRLPASWLTPVKPPLPPEPSDGSIVRITALRPGVPAPKDFIFPAHLLQRERGRLHSWRGLAPNGYDWEWEGICELGDPVLLVPDPFAEPVQLPWTHSVGPASSTAVRLGRDFIEDVNHAAGDYSVAVRHTTESAKAKARALWAAANQADKEGET